MVNPVRVIAFYLPQFYPTPENDLWWGKGFTEWTNVGKAKVLFKGHFQPRVPADLGYYDLRVPEVREAQAQLAKDAGVYGFCYWHYWFGNGKRLLEKPFTEVLISGKPDFPFCLGWANESWELKMWDAKDVGKNKVLVEQKYPGAKDFELHFLSILEAFKDKRYITVDDKPLFYIYKPNSFKGIDKFIEQWQILARQHGIDKGLFFVGHTTNFNEYNDLLNKGFDAINVNPMSRVSMNFESSQSFFSKNFNRFYRLFFKKTTIFEYSQASKLFVIDEEDSIENVIPTILPNWDHSPRSGKNAWILHNSTPKFFEKNVMAALDCIKNKNNENKIIFLKSWNEWGEGNYMEPDIRFKHGYLDSLKNALSNRFKDVR